MLADVVSINMVFNQFRQSSTRQQSRMIGFHLAIVVFLLMWLMIFSEGLIGVFRIWLDPSIAGDHFVHGATFMTMIWIFGLAMLVQLYRPTERVTAMQVALVVVIVGVLIAPVQIAVGTFDPMLLVFFAPVIIAAALHPARGELLDSDAISEAATKPVLLALVGLAVIPVALYAAGQANLQLTLADDHAADEHYSSMAAFVGTMVVFAALAAISDAPRRFAAYAAGLAAVVLAVASVYQPTVSAIDPLWSALAGFWGLAVVIAFEWSVRRSHRDEAVVEKPAPTR